MTVGPTSALTRVLLATIAALLTFQLFTIYQGRHQAAPVQDQAAPQVPQQDEASSNFLTCTGDQGDDTCFDALVDSIPPYRDLDDECHGKPDEPRQEENSRSPRLAVVTAQFGAAKQYYEEALRTQMMLSKVHNFRLLVLRSKITDVLWNKPAHILSILLDEMAKPEDERLEWLLWVDRDVVVLDKCRTPAAFLPPSAALASRDDEPKTGTEGVNMLVTSDWNGLNNGIFLVRVGRWSLDLFSDIIAYRHYNPDIELKFTEQTAMELLLADERYHEAVTWVPQWWFNAYPGPQKPDDTENKGDTKEYHARRGDFLVHFAGVPHRGDAMRPWLDLAESGDWGERNNTPARDLDSEIQEFWRNQTSKDG
ncbi:uncharacterized protein J7T54_007923 [Emericellopsis cladophorae]|uniref:Galactosyl transferase GMA12/MNN10 family protein n=1 Tax=Emericellopsis cladophorae TaxID=2686198 RepID=A0A9P9Y8A3_9HYPO|nr:uncharacterized protein J7T54_007923 [Emericellopsis cladophorae]KAI6784830.1 hypothetical protein J7T54_007923 [Emericellopsis cladophorae]